MGLGLSSASHLQRSPAYGDEVYDDFLPPGDGDHLLDNASSQRAVRQAGAFLEFAATFAGLGWGAAGEGPFAVVGAPVRHLEACGVQFL